MITLPSGDKYAPQKLADITGKSIQSIYNYSKSGWPTETLELLMLKLDGKIIPTSWYHSQFNHLGFLELNGAAEALEFNDLINMQYRNQIQYTALNARNQQARKDTETINAQKKEIEQLKLMINEQNADQNSAANDPYLLNTKMGLDNRHTDR